MASVAHKPSTPEEYLALERKAEFKSEYVNGEIYAMSGASEAHNLISMNVAGVCWQQTKGKPCKGYTNDMRVKVSATGLYTYPDVVVLCGHAVFDDLHRDTLTNPTVLVEVLSPSTEAYDRGDKFAHYLNLLSLQEYVLVSQDKVRVEHFARRDAEWIYTQLNALDDVLALQSIECAVALHDIYERVEFADDTTVAGNEAAGGADGRR